MSAHITPLSNKNLNLVFRIYTNESDHDEAYEERKRFNAVCLASIKPKQKIAWVHSMFGKITKADYIDIAERLYTAYGITELEYERAKGYLVSMKRRSYRRWLVRRKDKIVRLNVPIASSGQAP